MTNLILAILVVIPLWLLAGVYSVRFGNKVFGASPCDSLAGTGLTVLVWPIVWVLLLVFALVKAVDFVVGLVMSGLDFLGRAVQ